MAGDVRPAMWYAGRNDDDIADDDVTLLHVAHDLTAARWPVRVVVTMLSRPDMRPFKIEPPVTSVPAPETMM